MFFKHAMFQSTPPRGGRRGFPPAFFLQHGFQSTPPRGGRLCGDTHGLGRDIVSIHAPARGATGKHYVDETNIDVSIHAPARGATEGRRRHFPGQAVSIHAPARGATLILIWLQLLPMRFNPRPRAGGDPPSSNDLSKCLRFNPRPRAGGDPTCNPVSRLVCCFNPRPRAGGDL